MLVNSAQNAIKKLPDQDFTSWVDLRFFRWPDDATKWGGIAAYAVRLVACYYHIVSTGFHILRVAIGFLADGPAQDSV
jgi:hypothetical protein